MNTPEDTPHRARMIQRLGAEYRCSPRPNPVSGCKQEEIEDLATLLSTTSVENSRYSDISFVKSEYSKREVDYTGVSLPHTPPITPERARRVQNMPNTGNQLTRCHGYVGDRPCTQAASADSRFCGNHVAKFEKKVCDKIEFYSRKSRTWVDKWDYIPQYLHESTIKKLWQEMNKPPSASDTPGYVYVFEIRNADQPNIFQFKVGFTARLNFRLDEWAKKCCLNKHEIRGWWPKSIINNAAGTNTLNNDIFVEGFLNPGPTGSFCRKLESLILIELQDLETNRQYLDQGCLGISRRPEAPHHIPKNCHCGTKHKEIFTLERPKKGLCRAREWENIVMPVIQRWGDFVERHVA